MSLRNSTEKFFERWSEFVVHHAWLVVVVVLGITFLTIPQIRHGKTDLSIESYLPKGDVTIEDFDEFRQQYGYGNPAMLVVVMEDGIFTLENLQRLKNLHDELEKQVPYSEEVISLVNVRYTRGEGDSLLIDELGELWPTTEAELPAFRELVLGNPNYVGGIVSSDGKVTSVVVKPNVYSSAYQQKLESASGFSEGGLGDLLEGFEESVELEKGGNLKIEYIAPQEELDFSRLVVEVQQKHIASGFEVYGAGGPIMNYKLAIDMEAAMGQSMLLGFAIIIVLLSFLFRRVSGVVMPLMAVSLSVATTMALWPILGHAFNGNTQIIPSFLIAVGIADAVHILSIFYRRYDGGEEKGLAIINAMKQTAVAVVMTTVTTAASLLSFMMADLIPTVTMGFFGAIGVVLALVYTMLLMPALLAVMPIRRKTLKDVTEHAEGHSEGIMGWIDGAIFGLGDFGVRHAKAVVVVAGITALFFMAGVAQIKFSHDPISWYPEGSELRKATDAIDTHLSGTITQQVLFDTHRENALYEPEVLGLLERAEDLIKNFSYEVVEAQDALSILSVVKETHKALNGNDDDYFVVPDNREIIAQELLLFENGGTDDMEDFTDSTLRHARIMAQMPWTNVIYFREYNRRLTLELQALIEESGLKDITVKMVGLLVVFGKAVHILLIGTVESYMVAFGLVCLLMILLMGDVRRGLLAFSPNILPILFTVGLMGWLGVPLNILTSTVGCIIIGISVDDTIHFMHHFRRYSLEGNDARAAVHKTLETCGRAITFTSIVLVGGFIVHALDSFLTSKQFGLSLSLAIILALLANLLLAPALMTLFWEKK